jgi:hypothetical protein
MRLCPSPEAPSPDSVSTWACWTRSPSIWPVVMGSGNRPFFGELSSEDVLLDNPTVCIQGDRVTHLVFPVSR